MITPEAWTPVIINIYYLYIYLFICWKSKIIVKNAYIVFYWAQKQSFAPKYSQRTECVDNSVKSLRGSNYNYTDCTQHDYSVHEGTTPKIHSFSGWHSVIKEFQKEIDSWIIYTSNLFFPFSFWARIFRSIVLYTILTVFLKLYVIHYTKLSDFKLDIIFIQLIQ